VEQLINGFGGMGHFGGMHMLCTSTCGPTISPVHICRSNLLSVLPEELLWTMLQSLDVPTLCTARLVCKHFRKCATGHFKTLCLDCSNARQHRDTDLAQFSGVTRVSVSLISDSNLYVLAQPGIAPLVRHIHIQQPSPWSKRQAGNLAQLMLLPKLRSLSIPGDLRVIQHLPAGLDELILPTPIRENPLPLTRFSGLTSLAVYGETVSAAPPSLGALTALSCLGSLRSLQLCSFSPSSGVLSTFTMLTSLTWLVSGCTSPGSALSGLSHLTGLASLELSNIWDLDLEGVAHIASLTGLTSLDLSGCRLADDVGASSALAPLTHLVRLGLFRGRSAKSFLPSLNLEALHSLTVGHVERDVTVTQRARGLTHLKLFHTLPDLQHELDAVLARMTNLRSLHLCITGPMPCYMMETAFYQPGLVRVDGPEEVEVQGPFHAG
jgi:hypothetical protein